MFKRLLRIAAGIGVLSVALLTVWYFVVYTRHPYDMGMRHSTFVGSPPQPLSTTRSAPDNTTRRMPNKRVPPQRPGPKCAMAMTLGSDGALWVASEGEGVFRYWPTTGTWIQYTTKDGLGDDTCYAIVCDRRGRIWAGHVNHGLSIFDGARWANYDLSSVPLGERVFAIAESPLDGDMWIASNMGLTRYSVRSDSWHLYTQASGLPLNYPSSLAFIPDGTLFVGTDSDGIMRARAGDDYAHWDVVASPQSPPADAEAGDGLPCGHINCLLGDRLGNVYAATTSGLAESSDSGTSWRYVRGVPLGTTGAMKWEPSLLLEDYVTTLAVDDNGRLYIGHRRHGWEVFDTRSRRRVEAAHGRAAAEFVTAIAPVQGAVLFGTNGTGVTIPDLPAGRPSGAVPPEPAALPSKAPPPSVERLRAIVGQLDRVRRRPPVVPTIVALDDDWRTQGDWVGRYGRFWACLGAMAYPEYVWNPGPQQIEYTTAIGLNHRPGEFIRHYVASLYTSDRRCLEMPSIYYDSRVRHALVDPAKQLTRRASVWDDHGEAYASSVDGPDLVFTVAVPEGPYCLSLYDANQGGQVGRDRFKDYPVFVRPLDGAPATRPDGVVRPTGVRARIRSFWSGTYKRFFVTGPATYQVTIKRAGSYNATLAAIMLDPFEEEPPPYFVQATAAADDEQHQTRAGGASAFAQPEPVSSHEFAETVFARLERLRKANPTWWATTSRPFYWELMRYYVDSASGVDHRGATDNGYRPLRRLATCYMYLGLYDQWEKCRRQCGLKTIRDIEKSLKWDGVTDSYRDKAYKTIRAVAERGAADAAAIATD